ncbi:MAG: CU044_2847 family protein [Cyanobacteria bacterium J06649_12]
MRSSLIELNDGILVEARVSEDQTENISSGFAQRVDSTFERIKPLLLKVCKQVLSTWEEVNQEVEIEQIEVEVGLSFEGTGNVFITQSKAAANLNVTLILKPSSK